MRLCALSATADGYVTKDHYKRRKNMEKKMIDKMVDRFLCWKLPADFAPDCGISFDSHNGQCEPVGTNLFTAEQAKRMFEHVTAEPELNERMNCENCNQVYEREYSNGGKQCFGLVKDTFRDCDVIRACQKYDNGKMFLQDLSPDEAAEMATGYAAVVRTWFSFFYQRPCGSCEQKESDCNGSE